MPDDAYSRIAVARAALEFLAHPDHWVGDPEQPYARLIGARTAYQVARDALLHMERGDG